eukprot:TRINITY_DN17259_c0_g1_i1.p1 TRINITY_DN17259_c0_g1~~TRINITY_DN17259_c0_g1_i1.p1  ORF type:complete len:287 (-),score=56.83 TRINITY_DN17259_c0_g1_i1:118-978(-)
MAAANEERCTKRARIAKPELQGAIVTGAASGIGLAIAKLLASKGYRVLLADRDADAGRREAEALGQLFWRTDVSDEASIKSCVKYASEHLPNISFLVNCAGCDFYSDFDESYPASQFDRAVHVNLRSVWLMCREAVSLLKRSRGSIVNVASIQAHRSFPGYSAYAATKGGIISMSRQLAGDLARYGIRVNSVSPGAVHTNLGKNSCKFENQAGDPDESVPSVEDDGLLGVLRPADVADAICSMLSLRGVTGQDLVVDGGCSIIGVAHWKPTSDCASNPQLQDSSAS